MDNPGDAKYGMSEDQMAEAYTRMLKAMGAEEFGIHAFLASNTVTDDYYPEAGRHPVRTGRPSCSKRTGAHIAFINLSGGVGIPYRPDQRSQRHRWPSARACARHLRRSWCPPGWAM